MRLRPLNALALLAPAPALAAQAPFASAPPPGGDWSLARAPPANATGHLIFDTVRSLLQHWPNTRYRNGHAIVPGTVPAGTLLYHGTGAHALPTVPEWTATDPEHSLLFCRTMHRPLAANASVADVEEDGCYHLTLAATRALKVLYFDGSSAAKMRGGPMDSQDLVAWGAVREEKVFAERERIAALCEWAAPLGVDGFVRMEMDFEIMLCDFTVGVEVVSFLNLAAPAERRGPPQVPPREPPSRVVAPRLPTPRAGAPVGLDARVLESGSWHNGYPGDARIALDYTRLITLYDAGLAPSLSLARVGVPRLQHRLADASAADLARFREVLDGEIAAWVAEVDAGVVVGGTGSGVDWRTLFNTIAERYAARLEVLAHLLNTTDAGAPGRAQRQLRGMIAPYVLQDATPTFHASSSADDDDEHPWAAGVFAQCATAHTAPIARRSARLTRGERVLLRAAEDAAREICRVLVGLWAEGVERGLGTGTGAELSRLGTGEVEALVERWHARVVGLMGWLDWSGYWLRCRPACGFEEMCILPTWPFFTFPGRGGPQFMERVRDVVERRAAPDDGKGDWEDPQPSCMGIVEPAGDDEEMWVVV